MRNLEKRHAEPAKFVAASTGPLFGKRTHCDGCQQPFTKGQTVYRDGVRRLHRFCHRAFRGDSPINVAL
jgi:hypothetical protein